MIKVKGLKKSFSKDHMLFDDFNLNVSGGEFCILMGMNGSGKSTLMSVLSGLIYPDAGSVEIKGSFSRVIQNIDHGTLSELSVFENLSLSKIGGFSFRFYHRFKKNLKNSLSELGLGLEELLNEPMKNLSGGQRQMIAVFMAIQNNHPILFLDEHTSALDVISRDIINQYLSRVIQKKQLTVLMITHDLNEALCFGDRLIVLNQGLITHDIAKNEKRNLSMNDLSCLLNEKSLSTRRKYEY